MNKEYEIEKHWTTKSGLEALILIYYYGNNNEFKSHRCGYIAIDKNHPLYGINYNEECDLIQQRKADNAKIGKNSLIVVFTGIDWGENRVKRSPLIIFDVHGGLTYSDYYILDDNYWCFGFDCIHSGDAKIDNIDEYSSFFNYHGVVRTKEYVKEECESLAQQLIDFQKEIKIEKT